MAPRPRRRPGQLVLGPAAPWWRRSPGRAGRWLLAVGLAVLAATLLNQLTSSATATVADWGTTRPVIVARRDLDVGRTITTDDVIRQERPDAVVPPSAETDDPIGRAVTRPIVAGEVVSDERLAPDGAQGLAALVPVGRRAVAVPTAGTGVHLHVGDRVDVYSTGSAGSADALAGIEASSNPSAGDPAASDAVVVDVGDAAVTLAVEAPDVAALARALGQGTPVLALRGAG